MVNAKNSKDTPVQEMAGKSKDAKYETDLSKASRFAVDRRQFGKLAEGDMKSAINLLVYIDKNEAIRETLFDEMYKDYVQMIAARSVDPDQTEIFPE